MATALSERSFIVGVVVVSELSETLLALPQYRVSHNLLVKAYDA